MIPLHEDNPVRIVPVVTIAVLLACVAIFLWQLTLADLNRAEAVYGLGMIPATLFTEARLSPELHLVPPLATLFTSMFLHGGWMHLLGNMLYLWIFGNNVEEAMGHGRFVIFYLICGIAAAMAQGLPDPASQVPMIGASGAISGVLGGYLLLYPRARVLVLVPFGWLSQVIRVPAFWVLGLWFVIQLVNKGAAADDAGGVAWWAHIGGFVAGLILVPLFKRQDVPLLRREVADSE